MRVLAIETSCDETSAAVVHTGTDACRLRMATRWPNRS